MQQKQRSPRIAIGLDGSAGSAHALKWAIDMAERLGAEIVAVHIEPFPTYIPESLGFVSPTEAPEKRAELQQTFVAEWCAPLRNSGVRFRGIVEEGTPGGMALIEVGVREGADMIVVGSRGRNSMAELLLGSFSHQVAHHSTIPVVIVPQTVKARAEAIASGIPGRTPNVLIPTGPPTL